MGVFVVNTSTAIALQGQSFSAVLEAVDQRLLQWQTSPDAWDQLLQKVFGRSASVDLSSIVIELLDAATMVGLHGAYAPITPDGDERIYLNAEWLNSASATEVEAVLLEELGHALDWRINGSNDTAGDEGAIFSALIRSVWGWPPDWALP